MVLVAIVTWMKIRSFTLSLSHSLSHSLTLSLTLSLTHTLSRHPTLAFCFVLFTAMRSSLSQLSQSFSFIIPQHDLIGSAYFDDAHSLSLSSLTHSAVSSLTDYTPIHGGSSLLFLLHFQLPTSSSPHYAVMKVSKDIREESFALSLARRRNVSLHPNIHDTHTRWRSLG
jgi:hypothetical protein